MNVQGEPELSSNLRTMRALIAKDWRFFRVPMVALLIATGAWVFYSLWALGLWLWLSHPADMRWWVFNLIDEVASYGTGVVALIAAAFGGVAIARERAERTADFLAMLPVTRMQIVLSKWLVSLVMLGACLGIPGLVGLWFLLHGTPRHEHDNGDNFFRIIAMYEAFAIGFYGVAWMLGAWIRSAPISACAGIAATLAAAVLMGTTLQAQHYPSLNAEAVMVVATAGIGLAGLLFGTVCYLRRISP